MIFYRRNIYNKLIALRSISIVTGFLCYLSFDANKNNLGYFLAVVLALLSIIVIEDFVVFPDSFQVKKYYFFGFLPIRWNFIKDDKIFLVPDGYGFGKESDPEEFFDSDVGCLFLIFSVFSKQGKITHLKFTIKKQEGKSRFLNQVDIFLSREEHQLINNIISK